ncbi:MAG: hypothetical protein R3C99_24485 [Pirellulaceae bacterium]
MVSADDVCLGSDNMKRVKSYIPIAVLGCLAVMGGITFWMRSQAPSVMLATGYLGVEEQRTRIEESIQALSPIIAQSVEHWYRLRRITILVGIRLQKWHEINLEEVLSSRRTMKVFADQKFNKRTGIFNAGKRSTAQCVVILRRLIRCFVAPDDARRQP